MKNESHCWLTIKSELYVCIIQPDIELCWRWPKPTSTKFCLQRLLLRKEVIRSRLFKTLSNCLFYSICENQPPKSVMHMCKYILCILLRILDFICNCTGKNSKTQMPWRVNKWVKSFQSSHVQKLISSNCWNIEIIPAQCDYRMQCLYQPQRRRKPQSRSTFWLRSQRLQKSRSGSWIVGLLNSLLILN